MEKKQLPKGKWWLFNWMDRYHISNVIDRPKGTAIKGKTFDGEVATWKELKKMEYDLELLPTLQLGELAFIEVIDEENVTWTKHGKA